MAHMFACERLLVDVQNQQVSSIAAGLPGRYAIALFGLARDEKALDATAESLGKLEEVLHSSADFRRLIHAPEVSRKAAGAAVGAIAADLGLAPLVCHFLGVLAENRRLMLLPEVIRQFQRMLSRSKGRETAEVTSAQPLTPAQTEALQARLRQLTGEDVEIANQTDPAILGGIVVRLGSRQIDSSIRTRLARLGQQMKGQL